MSTAPDEASARQAPDDDVFVDPNQGALVDGFDLHDQQWRLESLLLCNWGGFGGVHAIEVHPRSSLVSGATGAGKSTILDAYTCLMNPTKAFNAASNEAGAKTRGEGIRTPLTYVRGVYDQLETDDGTVKSLMLRGTDHDTWSVISAVFASSTAARFSILRMFYAPRDAAEKGDMTQVYAVYPAKLTEDHIRGQFPTLAQSRFRKDHIERAFPDMQVMGQTDFSNATQQHLAIGTAQAGGEKALKLLYDLQSGVAVESVDGLFKRLVLSVPSTYDTADAVISSFDQLADAHEEMRQKEHQTALLATVEEDHARLLQAQTELSHIDTLRLDDPDRSPFTLWAARRKNDLYDAETARLDALAAELRSAQEELDARAAELATEHKDTNRRWLSEGGSRIEDIEAERDRLTAALTVVRRNREKLAGSVAAMGHALPDTKKQFAALVVAAEQLVAEHDSEHDRLKAQHQEAVMRHGEAKREYETAQAEAKDLEGRSGNIRRDRHLQRLTFAEAAGLAPEDLPFVGELIDMADDQEDWRVAADAVLGGFANTLLVDERHRRTLRTAIDGVSSRIRLSYRGVDTGDTAPAPAPVHTLAGKLVVKPGPFAGWLRSELNRSYAHSCVDSAADMTDRGDPQVTKSGQTQAGRKGSHGGHGMRTIGFSNEERRAELREQLVDLADRLQQLAVLADNWHDAGRKLSERRLGCAQVAATEWADIDEATLAEAVASTEAALKAAQAGTDALHGLQDRLAQLAADRDEVRESIGQIKSRLTECDSARSDLATQVDTFRERLWALEDDELVVLTDEVATHLDGALAETSWDGSLDTFDSYCAITGGRRGVLLQELESGKRVARSRRDEAETALTSAFARFDELWHDPNRGTGLGAFPEYAAIVRQLREDNLSGQRQEWGRRVVQWSGEDVLNLLSAYDGTVHDINERLRPIQRILSQIPFSAETTLSVVTAERAPQSVRLFRQELRQLADGSMSPPSDPVEVEEKFAAIATVINRIRPASKERDQLLDVRLHLKVTATAVTADGTRVRSFDNLRGKSGGETQTLTAFIVGAALRYHLGDEQRDRPRFMPVVLDEAFIRADVRHAARSVQAWRQLGFQLLIGAPEGQFGALEPAVNRVIAVTKDAGGNSYALPLDPSAKPTPRSDD